MCDITESDYSPEKLLATVEALERVTRELEASRNAIADLSEDADRCIAAAEARLDRVTRERDEACDLYRETEERLAGERTAHDKTERERDAALAEAERFRWTSDKQAVAWKDRAVKAERERDEARASEKDTWANWESRVAALKEQIQEAKADAARLREALEKCVEAMDSADYFRTLALHATTADLCKAAIDHAREALEGGGK